MPAVLNNNTRKEGSKSIKNRIRKTQEERVSKAMRKMRAVVHKQYIAPPNAKDSKKSLNPQMIDSYNILNYAIAHGIDITLNNLELSSDQKAYLITFQGNSQELTLNALYGEYMKLSKELYI